MLDKKSIVKMTFCSILIGMIILSLLSYEVDAEVTFLKMQHSLYEKTKQLSMVLPEDSRLVAEYGETFRAMKRDVKWLYNLLPLKKRERYKTLQDASEKTTEGYEMICLISTLKHSEEGFPGDVHPDYLRGVQSSFNLWEKEMPHQ